MILGCIGYVVSDGTWRAVIVTDGDVDNAKVLHDFATRQRATVAMQIYGCDQIIQYAKYGWKDKEKGITEVSRS